MKYLIEYGSSQQEDGTFISTSRDAKKHGRELFGSDGHASGGYVVAYVGRNEDVEDIHERKLPWMEELKELKSVSMARYTPLKGGRWYNCYMELLSMKDVYPTSGHI